MWTAADLAAQIERRTADGIARGVAALVSRGDLPADERLPTVRDLAAHLGVSPTTVSQAWKALIDAGVIEAKGRLGTTVRGAGGPAAPTRFSRLRHATSPLATDLSHGTPDPDLLPDLGPGMRQLGRHAAITSYFEPPVLPELEALLRADWPFAPEALTVVDGAMDAVDRVFEATLRFGDRVLVENPTFPPILDLLEQRGVTVVGLPMDERGILPAALQSELAAGPVAALLIQPRAQNPCGYTMTPQRARAVATALRGHRGVVVIEDDHGAALSSAKPVSVGARLPEQTVHIRGFSKSHGPDLRLAAVGGSRKVVERLMRRRLLGPAWSSRLLQALLLHLLTDPASIAEVAHARETYGVRRRRLVDELASRGVNVSGTDGINLWVEVHNERSALLDLSVNQILAAPGSPFLSSPLPTQHIRVTCSCVDDDAAALADKIARAAMPSDSVTRYMG